MTPELERFASELVAQGRYGDVNAVILQGLRMLQDAEASRRDFVASLGTAVAEAERDGYATLDEVLADLDEIIASRPSDGRGTSRAAGADRDSRGCRLDRER